MNFCIERDNTHILYGKSEGFVAETICSLGLLPVLHKRILALSKGYSRRLMALALLTPYQSDAPWTRPIERFGRIVAHPITIDTYEI